MTQHIKGDIHKLEIGDKIYTIGKFNDNIRSKIVEILKDEEFFDETGKIKFLIIAQDEKGINWLWAEEYDKPYTIQYARPSGEYISYQ